MRWMTWQAMSAWLCLAVLKLARKWNVRAFNMEHTIHSFGWGAQIGVVNELVGLWKHSTVRDPSTSTQHPYQLEAEL